MRMTADGAMDDGLLWQGFLPRLMNLRSFSSRQHFFLGSMQPSIEHQKAGKTPVWKKWCKKSSFLYSLRDADEHKFLFDLSRRGCMMLTLVAEDRETGRLHLVLATGGAESRISTHPGSLYRRERCIKSHDMDLHQLVIAIMVEGGGCYGGFSFMIHYPMLPDH